MIKNECKVDYALSVSDLWLVEGFKEAFMTGNEAKVKQYLFENGMDVAGGFEEVLCQHRNLQNKVTMCIRYEGYERLDKEWIQSGAASMDAVIGSSNDPHMRATLRTMSKQVQQDQSWQELEEEAFRKAKGEELNAGTN